MGIRYLKVKAQYPKVGRCKETLAVIKKNNSLLRTNKYDIHRIYNRMRKYRGLKKATKPLRFETPVEYFN